MKKIRLEFVGSEAYTIRNNMLTQNDGDRFHVAFFLDNVAVNPNKSDIDRIIVGHGTLHHSIPSSNFSINNGSVVIGGDEAEIHVGGVSIVVRAGVVSIVNENDISVYLNGEEMETKKEDIDTEKYYDDSLFEKLDLSSFASKVNFIGVGGSATVAAFESDRIVDYSGMLTLEVSSVGNLSLQDVKGIGHLVVANLGHGNIKLKRLLPIQCVAKNFGSGDIIFDDGCVIKNLEASVYWTGDILGNGAVALSILKISTSEGSISGFTVAS